MALPARSAKNLFKCGRKEFLRRSKFFRLKADPNEKRDKTEKEEICSVDPDEAAHV